MAKTALLTAKRPKSIWQKPLKFDTKTLLKAAGKAVTHFASGKLDELGSDAAEAASGLGLETSPSNLAYQLILRSCTAALSDLSKESASHFDTPEQLGAVEQALDNELGTVEVVVSKEFFNSPLDQPFVRSITDAYSQWLCDAGIAPPRAKAIADRLPAYIVSALAAEWRKNADAYQQLLDQSDSPFDAAEANLNGWNRYFAHLERRVSESVFDEPFSLSQIYVPLNAYYVDHQPQTPEKPDNFFAPKRRCCVNLEDELLDWIVRYDRHDALRVISGGPGSGKSSFARIFCHHVAARRVARPILIPLHLIDPTQDVESEVKKFIANEGVIGFDPLDPNSREQKLLLAFDGLDELASTGKVAAQVARDFIQAVDRLVERRALGPAPILVLLSGREVMVQENEREFRKPRQILNILPYFVSDAAQEFHDPNGILREDLRDVWWRKYGELLGEPYKGLPDALKIKEIDEITAQPLLNYLVALSFRRGKLDFGSNLNLNSVYRDLVVAVHERAYEKRRVYLPIKQLTLDEFVRVLEEIGLAAWHGADGRSTSVKEILSHCRQSGLSTIVDSFTEGAQAGVTKLLAAFFFRRNGDAVGEDSTFVFTHKSFGEYLAATRLVRCLDRIILERERRQANPDDGLDLPDALTTWTRLAGQSPLTENMLLFLNREISGKTIEVIERSQQHLLELISYAIDNSLPLERMGNLSFQTCTRFETNALTSIFVAMNATSVALARVARLQFKDPTAFGTFLRRLCPQRAGAASPLLYSALSYLDLSNQCLDIADLYGANLQGSVFRNARLYYVNLDRANLENADFSDSILSWSRIQASSLRGTNFSRAKLEKVVFRHSHPEGPFFVNVNFSEANLSHANLLGLRLHDCDFSRAILVGTNLHKCREIRDCVLTNALVDKRDKSLINWANDVINQGLATGPLDVQDK